jgi:hypothetical protein
MTAEANADDQELARAKTMRTIAIVIAVVAFAVLVYGFGMLWKPWYQVAAGVAAYAGVEWQRRCGQKIKELEGKKAG